MTDLTKIYNSAVIAAALGSRTADLKKAKIHSVLDFVDFCIEKEGVNKSTMEIALMHYTKSL
jgi:hypothetical protein